ncbi:MAG: rRNA maturation RNase YbeY [Schumannella sp.]
MPPFSGRDLRPRSPARARGCRPRDPSRGRGRRCSCTCSGWTSRPTDVLSFPMDELRPGNEEDITPPGLLGDIVLCSPQVAVAQAEAGGPRARWTSCFKDRAVPGILHLLGLDHAEPDDEREMFEVQRDILVGFTLAERRR